MFDNLWHLHGSVQLESDVANSVALDRIEQFLEKQQERVSERGSDHVAFNGPLWSEPFRPNWLPMVIYDRGRFSIEQDDDGRRLHYDLRSLHGMVFCLFAAFMAFWFGFRGGGALGRVKFAAGTFAWLYGMNVLLARIRVPSAIRRAATNA